MTSYRVGLIGCGHISATHLRGWRKTARSRVTSVFDLERTVAESTAARFGISHVARSIHELIESSDIVDICSPPAAHAEQLETALEAKRHVLIEKPVVLGRNEWDSISKKLAGGESSLAVVHHLKFVDSVRRARRWVSEGRIGRVLRFDSLFLTSPTNDRMLSAANHWSQPLPGGRWLETLPHNLYLLHTFAGPMAVERTTVIASPAGSPNRTAREVTVTLRGDDCLARIDFSANCELNIRTATIIGTEGFIKLDLLSNLATLHRIGDTRLTRRLGRGMLEAASQFAQSALRRPATATRRLRGWTPHATLIAEFERHLSNAEPPPTPLAEIEFVVDACATIGEQIDRQL